MMTKYKKINKKAALKAALTEKTKKMRTKFVFFVY